MFHFCGKAVKHLVVMARCRKCLMNFFYPRYFDRTTLTKVGVPLLSHLIFWVWNLVFIALMYLWLLPQIGFELVRATRMGEVEPTFVVSFIALMVVPLVCTLLGFFRLRRRSDLLMGLFFGVEAPLFALCLLRLFLIRELTLATGFVLGLVVVAIAMYAIELLSGYAAYRPGLAKVQMVSHSLMLLAGVYVGTLLLLYSLTAAGNISISLVSGLFSLDFGAAASGVWDALIYCFLHPLEVIAGLASASVAAGFLFLGLSSVCIFLVMPYAFSGLYVRAWMRIRKAFGRQYDEQTSWTITGVTLALSCLLFVLVQSQPQIKAFDLLETSAIASEVTPAEQATPTALPEATVAKRQVLLERSEDIKSGLINAYLYRYRYLSPWSESNYLGQMYIDTFGFSKGAAQFIQNIHNGLLSPFLYRGDRADDERAAELYAQFFDEPIQKGERAAVQTALSATANRDETQAGLLNVDQEVVYLASQSVSVEEQGDWATVEIQEEYENPTIEDQEIFYSFSLPESAAISGLWLGTADDLKLFPFVVSPRGAAQKVYKAEVERAKFQRATDPALLEQVGPRQYRLRVFPIPARSNDTPGELHLTMRYQVMQQADSQTPQWPLPQLSEKRNIFWTKETSYIRASGQANRADEDWENEWFEAGIPAERVKAAPHVVALGEGNRVTVRPFTREEKPLPAGKALAVVVDSSYSMGEHRAALKAAIAQLLESDNPLDFYVPVVGSQIDKAQSSVEVDEMMFYGSLQPADILRQFSAASNGKRYDAVLLLSDEGSYELAKNTSAGGGIDLPNFATPLWMVHVDGKLPAAYEDGLLQLLQASRGGVDTTATAVLQRLAFSEEEARALDGYTWRVEKANEGGTTASDADEMAAMAARQLIYQRSQTLDMTQVAELDAVHAIAKQTGVVTPYSSMLVLVDERQREALRQAEAAGDRFEREVEDGVDEMTAPGNPMSIPEPGQVMGLMVVAIALVLTKRRSKVASR